MKIIKQSKVKKAGGGGGVVVADKLFTAIILLPEEIERLIYSYLPTPERWGKEIILNRYNLPTFKQIIDADNFRAMVDSTAIKYRLITKGLYWLKQDSCHNYKMPTESRDKNPFLQWELPFIEKIQMLQSVDADADYNVLRDTVLIYKYYLECKKRNDVYRKKYRAEYNEIKCDEDGLLSKKFRRRGGERRIDGKDMARWKSNIMPVTEWINRELKRDRMFANDQCYQCKGQWYIKTEEECEGEGTLHMDGSYEPPSVEERSRFRYEKNYSMKSRWSPIKGETISPFIIKSATSDCSIKVVPDGRQCERCQDAEIRSRVAITMHSF